MKTSPMNQTQSTETPEYSVVVPVYNSQHILPTLHQRLTAVMVSLGKPYELVFVEDCGPDDSWTVMKELAAKDSHVVAVQLMRNSGQGNATLCGLGHAEGRIIMTMDDDLQHPPEEIPLLIRHLCDHPELDVVIGAPREENRGMFRRMGSRMINRLNNMFFTRRTGLRLTAFRAMRRAVAKHVTKIHSPYPSVSQMLFSITDRVENITVGHQERLEGSSGYTLARLIKQTFTMIITFSVIPLRVLAFIGGIGIAVSVFMGCFYLMRYFTGGIGVPGWTSLLLVLLTTSGFVFFAFGILGEYVYRIFWLSTGSVGAIGREVYRAPGAVGAIGREVYRAPEVDNEDE